MEEADHWLLLLHCCLCALRFAVAAAVAGFGRCSCRLDRLARVERRVLCLQHWMGVAQPGRKEKWTEPDYGWDLTSC